MNTNFWDNVTRSRNYSVPGTTMLRLGDYSFGKTISEFCDLMLRLNNHLWALWKLLVTSCVTSVIQFKYTDLPYFLPGYIAPI